MISGEIPSRSSYEKTPTKPHIGDAFYHLGIEAGLFIHHEFDRDSLSRGSTVSAVIVRHSSLEARLQIHARHPSQKGAGSGQIGERMPDVTRAGGAVFRLEPGPDKVAYECR